MPDARLLFVHGQEADYHRHWSQQVSSRFFMKLSLSLLLAE